MSSVSASSHKQILKQLFRLNFVGTVLIAAAVAGFAIYGASVFVHKQDLAALRSRISMLSILGLANAKTFADANQVAQTIIEKLEANNDQSVVIALGEESIIGAVDPSETGKAFFIQPEIVHAHNQGEGISSRFSNLSGKTMLYLAQPIVNSHGLRLYVRVSVPVARLTDLTASDFLVLLVFLIGFIGITLLVSHSAAVRTIGPIYQLEKALESLGKGGRVRHVSIPDVPHFDLLAKALNTAANRLDDKIVSLENEKALSTRILSSIPDGIVAFDLAFAITRYNDTAAMFLGFRTPCHEKNFKRARLENLQLVEMLYEASRNNESVSKEICFQQEERKILQVLATPMHDRNGIQTGTILVLSDVTRIRKLETVRQDFVGNVAHELRTPVTSVRGFAELLTKSKTPLTPEKVERYSKIILRQASQMDSMITDLLTLASLDNTTDFLSKSGENAAIAEVLSRAVDLCSTRIAEQGADVSIACRKDLHAFVHPGLFEQAVFNLLDNAVKYGTTDTCKSIAVSAETNGTHLLVTVTDYKGGIPSEHLGRIFERFYRVDKGRSREQGGTGLGLAIVNHIAQIHGGQATVECNPNQRTTFTLRLPLGAA